MTEDRKEKITDASKFLRAMLVYMEGEITSLTIDGKSEDFKRIRENITLLLEELYLTQEGFESYKLYVARLKANIYQSLGGIEPERASAQMSPDDYSLVRAVVKSCRRAEELT